MDRSVNFFPNDLKYKSTVGGLKMGHQTDFNIMLNHYGKEVNVNCLLTKDEENTVCYPMKITSERDGQVEYSVGLTCQSIGLYFYHFEIVDGADVIYIGRGEDLRAVIGGNQQWQLTIYEEENGTQWLHGGIMYQIMPDRFNIGGKRLKTKKDAVYRDDWAALPSFIPNEHGQILNNDFFGGNILGIINKLDHLKSLGISVIYLNPIFEAYSNHKYDTGNYMKLDSDFGTLKDFIKLVACAEKKGIKIMLDGVFSHTGDDSLYFNRYGKYDSIGASQSDDSPYHTWYNFDKSGKYASWWGIDTLPETNENDAGFSEFITGEGGVLDFWTRLGIGGWRLDVADELPDEFLDKANRSIHRANPDAIMLGEVWEDASTKVAYKKRRRYFQGGQLHSVTNYPFKEGILKFIQEGDSHTLNNTVNSLINNYPPNVTHSLMNILGSHDTARILTLLGENTKSQTRQERSVAKLANKEVAINLLKLAIILQYTLVGVPCIYYGDEFGMEGFEDPFNRRCIDWNNGNQTILKWYQKLARIRMENKDIFACGTLEAIEVLDGIYVYSRTSKSGQIIMILNNTSNNYEFKGDYLELLSGAEYIGYTPAFSSSVLRIKHL